MADKKIIPYDIFKLIVAILLFLLFLFLLWRAQPVTTTSIPATGEATLVVVQPTLEATTVSATEDVATADSATDDDSSGVDGNSEVLPTINLTDQEWIAGANTITGTAAADMGLQIMVNGEEVTDVRSDADGYWIATVDLVEGENTLQAIEMNTDSSHLTASDMISIVVGSSQGEDASAVSEWLDLSIEALDSAIQMGEHEIQGTAAPDTDLSIFVDGVLVDTITSDGNGDWAGVVNLPEGDTTIRIVEADAGVVDRNSEVSLSLNVAAAEGQGTDSTAPNAVDNSICAPGKIKGSTYIVNYCENLTRIARLLNVTLADLLAANAEILDPNIIFPGQQLFIP